MNFLQSFFIERRKLVELQLIQQMLIDHLLCAGYPCGSESWQLKTNGAGQKLVRNFDLSVLFAIIGL